MNLLFDFVADKATKTIYMTREFAADLDLVWDAFTKQEILDQWYAPKPYRLHTKTMEFREGGRWLYTMLSPEMTSAEEAKRWSLVEFLQIRPKTTFSSKNTFADEHGKSVGDAFSMVKNTFTAGTDRTTVHIEKVFDDLATLEMMSTNGFKEGSAAGFNNLEELFRRLALKK